MKEKSGTRYLRCRHFPGTATSLARPPLFGHGRRLHLYTASLHLESNTISFPFRLDLDRRMMNHLDSKNIGFHRHSCNDTHHHTKNNDSRIGS